VVCGRELLIARGILLYSIQQGVFREEGVSLSVNQSKGPKVYQQVRPFSQKASWYMRLEKNTKDGGGEKIMKVTTNLKAGFRLTPWSLNIWTFSGVTPFSWFFSFA
jgi:hypothetical protein